MISELYLYSCEPSGKKLTDSEKRDGQRAGAYLASKGISIGKVLHEDIPVYAELAHKLVKAMGQGINLVHSLDARHRQSFERVVHIEDGKTESEAGVLLIGSWLFLEDLEKKNQAWGLNSQAADTLIQLKRNSIPDQGSTWSPGFTVSRGELPPLFPYPAPNGPELRSRPAYYYNQSAVIPFQRTKKGIQVLVIGSSKRKHLVVPKGIHEPGMSARESAAKESFEEAGVKGPVSRKSIGCYSYSKWGSVCTVTVYVQEVADMLPEKLWEERHRGRKWMSPGRAAAKIKEPMLGQMMQNLEQFVCEELI